VASACRPRGAATAPAATLGQTRSRAPSNREANMRGTTVTRAGVPVGTVTGLWRYPVKSMAAEGLTSVSLSWAGIVGDRRWAFVRPASHANGFPWHTIRENPAMAAYVPTLLDAERPDKSAVRVLTPGGKTYDLTDP